MTAALCASIEYSYEYGLAGLISASALRLFFTHVQRFGPTDHIYVMNLKDLLRTLKSSPLQRSCLVLTQHAPMRQSSLEPLSSAPPAHPQSRAPNGWVHILVPQPHGSAVGRLSRTTPSHSYCLALGRANDRTEHRICVRSDYLETRDCRRCRASRALQDCRCFEKCYGPFRSGEGRTGPVNRPRRDRDRPRAKRSRRSEW